MTEPDLAKRLPGTSVASGMVCGSGARGVLAVSAALLALTACSAQLDDSVDRNSGFIKELRPELLAIAAPFQDLQAVRLNPEDGCYYYRHIGPVETVMLPLRATNGRVICTQTKAAAEVAG